MPDPIETRQAPALGISWRDRIRTAIEAIVLLSCAVLLLGTLAGLCDVFVTGDHAGHRDFISYWAAGRQIVHHADPYDGATIFKIEQSAGYWPDVQPLIMRNPPPALLLVIPLGLLSALQGSFLWSAALLAGLILSVHLLWVMHGRPGNKVHLLGYTFGPALVCISSGQTALFVLVGLVLFLRFHRQRPFAAGLLLWLCALKPHLFLPFGAVLLVWIVVSRSYRLLAGAAVALAATSLIAISLDHSVWAQYNAMMRTSGIDHEFIPCLGVLFRLAIRPQLMALQYVPVVAACIWAIRFYWSRRERWDWMTDGALLMLVSLLASPYAWPTDHSILLPALLLGVYRATSRDQLWVPAIASALVEVAALAGKGPHYWPFLFLAPTWLAWFLYVSRKACASELNPQPAFLTPNRLSA